MLRTSGCGAARWTADGLHGALRCDTPPLAVRQALGTLVALGFTRGTTQRGYDAARAETTRGIAEKAAELLVEG